MASPETVYPEQFFNIPHPAAPIVNIQFRTKIDKNDTDITKGDYWESLTFNPSSFFNSFTLEDEGGVHKVNLTLNDKNFSNLENTIVKSMVATRLANQLVEKEEYSDEETEVFQFQFSKRNSANLRIRFGYSEAKSDDYIDVTSSKDSDWLDRGGTRGNMKPVLKSPWIYLQTLNIDFTVTSKGLEVSVEAMSVMGNFLQQAKLLEVYARVYGEPINVIERMMEKIADAGRSSGDTITYEILEGHEPKGYFNQDEGKEMIEIMLGSQPVFDSETGDQIQKYKSLMTILNELVGAVREIKYDKDGNVIPEPTASSEDAEEDMEELEEADQIFRYSYYVRETEDEIKIIFYYQDPQRTLNEQINAKTYVWLEEGNSIVKDLTIKTNTDFAMMNLPVINISQASGQINGQVARGRRTTEEDGDEEQVDFSIGHARDITAALESEEFTGMFARQINDITNRETMNGRLTPKQLAASLVSKIAADLNSQLFEGTIVLPGDPFYLFDDLIQPFTYLIKIIINRPNYLDAEGNFTPGGKSYLSGYYMVKKITHEISGGNFETRLEIQKFNSHGR